MKRSARGAARTARSQGLAVAPMRILHILPGLHPHGTEGLLARLISASDKSRFEHHVISLTSIGSVGEEIERMGTPVTALGLPGCGSWLWAPWRVGRYVARVSPDVVNGWLYDGNLAAVLASMKVGRPHRRVLWNIRHSWGAEDQEPVKTRVTARLGARWSGVPTRIVYNSQISAEQHERMGYCRSRTLVIPNGFDCDRFKPDPAARLRVRKMLRIRDDSPVVGLFARYHPMKDHRAFLEAAALVAAEEPDALFILAGTEVSMDNHALKKSVDELGISSRVRLLGQYDDMPALAASVDVVTLSSAWGDAVPNAIGEAMSCGIPCVATDVGDCADLIGDTGVIVRPRNPRRLAEGILKLLKAPDEERAALGQRARIRIESRYSMDVMVDRFESAYEEEVG